MTKAETAKILMLISALFPNWKPANIEFTTAAWNIVLKDYAYADIEYSLYDYTRTNKSGFAPSAGQLISSVEEKRKAKELSIWARQFLKIPDEELLDDREERKGIDRSWERTEPTDYNDLVRIHRTEDDSDGF